MPALLREGTGTEPPGSRIRCKAGGSVFRPGRFMLPSLHKAGFSVCFMHFSGTFFRCIDGTFPEFPVNPETDESLPEDAEVP